MMEFLASLLQVICIDVMLSSDNALVIAIACRSLPNKQRKLAAILGTVAAVLLRFIFTLLFLEIFGLPFVSIGGGLILLWIATHLLSNDKSKEHATSTSIWTAIRIIVIADAVMSLDNMMAIAAAARGSWPIIIFGLALSIPLIIFGSTIVAKLLERLPVLIWFGAGILGWVAGGLIASDPTTADFLRRELPMLHAWYLAAMGAGIALAGSWFSMKVKTWVALARPN